jgi:hypothetical protein
MSELSDINEPIDRLLDAVRSLYETLLGYCPMRRLRNRNNTINAASHFF